MSYEEFLASVRRRGEYPVDEAERVTEAVIATLGERLPKTSAEHLADQLPLPLASLLEEADETGRSWGVDEFITQVAGRVGEDEEAAKTDSRAVCTVISEQISGGEMNKLLSQLPTGYADLFGYAELS